MTLFFSVIMKTDGSFAALIIIIIIYTVLILLLTCISYESSVASGLMAAMPPSHSRPANCTVCGFCCVARQLGAAHAFRCFVKPFNNNILGYN